MTTKSNTSEFIAEQLLQIQAVFLRPDNMFTWSSGIKSPIYCDNRITLAYPELRTLIKNEFCKLIQEKFPETNLIAGVATAGIPQAALVADQLQLPLAYVRSSSKDHGRNNLIEGQIQPGSKAVVIEDLISTGGSSVAVIDNLKAAGVDVLGLVSIFSYNLPKAKNKLSQTKYYSLSDYDTLIKVALSNKLITTKDVETLETWKESMQDS